MKTASRWESLNVSCLLWPIVITGYLLLLPMTRMFTFSTKYFYIVHKIFLSPDRSHRRGPRSCSCSAGSCGRCLQSSFRENTSSPPFNSSCTKYGFWPCTWAENRTIEKCSRYFYKLLLSCYSIYSKSLRRFITDNDKNILCMMTDLYAPL